MTSFTHSDVIRLAGASQEILELQKFAVERANVYTQMTTKKAPLPKNTGFYISVNRHSLLDVDNPDVEFSLVDGYDGSHGRPYSVPRAFIFGEATAEEKEYQTYLKVLRKIEEDEN